MSDKQGYKVVAKIRGKLLSCSATWLDAEGKKDQDRILNYSTKYWTQPLKGCGPLAVFTTYVDALDFVNRTDDVKRKLAIFTCVYKQPSIGILGWSLWTPASGILGPLNMPRWTDLAIQVKLVRELSQNEQKA